MLDHTQVASPKEGKPGRLHSYPIAGVRIQSEGSAFLNGHYPPTQHMHACSHMGGREQLSPFRNVHSQCRRRQGWMGKARWALEPLLVTIPEVQFPCDANRKGLFLHFPGLCISELGLFYPCLYSCPFTRPQHGLQKAVLPFV